MAERHIRIVHPVTEAEPFAVIYKPAGLPSAPLAAGEDSAYTQATSLYPQLSSVIGRKAVEHGLLHRIDTATEGILLLAATQQFYEHIVKAQDEGKFCKTYLAQCQRYTEQMLQGFPPPPVAMGNAELRTLSVSSRFRPYGEKGREVRPVIEASGRAALKKASPHIYTTHIEFRDTAQHSVFCTIQKGYRHQVRCHLAWLGFPIIGDKVYNVQNTGEFLFKAYGISFPDLYSDKILHYHID